MVTRDVPAGKLAVGVPARIREPRPKPAADRTRRRTSLGMSGPVLELALIAVLILLNGVFVAAEIALVTVRRSRLQQLIDEGTPARRRVHAAQDAHPGRFLAVIQIGITFLGFLAAAFAAVSIVDGLAGLAGKASARSQGVAGAIALLVVTGAPDDLHDRLRRARAQADRPGPRRALRDLARRPIDVLGARLRAARRRS